MSSNSRAHLVGWEKQGTDYGCRSEQRTVSTESAEDIEQMKKTMRVF